MTTRALRAAALRWGIDEVTLVPGGIETHRTLVLKGSNRGSEERVSTKFSLDFMEGTTIAKEGTEIKRQCLQTTSYNILNL